MVAVAVKEAPGLPQDFRLVRFRSWHFTDRLVGKDKGKSGYATQSAVLSLELSHP